MDIIYLNPRGDLDVTVREQKNPQSSMPEIFISAFISLLLSIYNVINCFCNFVLSAWSAVFSIWAAPIRFLSCVIAGGTFVIDLLLYSVVVDVKIVRRNRERSKPQGVLNQKDRSINNEVAELHRLERCEQDREAARTFLATMDDNVEMLLRLNQSDASIFEGFQRIKNDRAKENFIINTLQRLPRQRTASTGKILAYMYECVGGGPLISHDVRCGSWTVCLALLGFVFFFVSLRDNFAKEMNHYHRSSCNVYGRTYIGNS
jgi:hypothetical protein